MSPCSQLQQYIKGEVVRLPATSIKKTYDVHQHYPVKISFTEENKDNSIQKQNRSNTIHHKQILYGERFSSNFFQINHLQYRRGVKLYAMKCNTIEVIH